MNEKKLPLYSILILIALAIIIIVIRVHSLGEPLDRDLTSYGYFAHQILGGEELYSYLIDHHPPGIYILFMLSELIWGYNSTGIIYTGIFFNLVTLLFIFLFIKKIANTKTALTGALFWALASNSMPLEANVPNTELFMNAFTVIALWSFVHFSAEKKKGLILTGLFFAIASVFKMVVIFPFLALTAYVIIEEFRKNRAGWVSASLRKIVHLYAPGFIIWSLVFFYFFILGRFSDFWNAVFVFNSDYSESITRNIFYYFTTAKEFFHPSQIEILFLALFSLFFLVLTAVRKKTTLSLRWPFFILLLFGIMIEVASPGYFFPHYYQLFVPILSIMSALFLYELYSVIKERCGRGALIAVIAVGLIPTLLLGYYQIKFMRMDGVHISEQKHQGIFTESFEMAGFIKERTAPCETIYVYGQDTGIYYYSKRRAATGIIFVSILFFGDEEAQRERQKNFYEDITNSPPAYFIWNLAWGDVNKSVFYDFLTERYSFKGRKFNYYLLFEFKDRERDSSGKPVCK